MAYDNVPITPGNGDPIATLTAADGTQIQVVAINFGGYSDSRSLGYVPTHVLDAPGAGLKDDTTTPTDIVLTGGWDGTHQRILKTTATGQLEVHLADTATFQGSGTFTTSEVARVNANSSPIAPTTYTATQTATITNTYWKSLRFFLNVTAAPTTTSETLTFKIYDVDPASTNEVLSYAFSALPAANSSTFNTVPQTFVFDIGPNASTQSVSNWFSVNRTPSALMHVKVVHSGSSPWSYSLGASLNL